MWCSGLAYLSLLAGQQFSLHDAQSFIQNATASDCAVSIQIATVSNGTQVIGWNKFSAQTSNSLNTTAEYVTLHVHPLLSKSQGGCTDICANSLRNTTSNNVPSDNEEVVSSKGEVSAKSNFADLLDTFGTFSFKGIGVNFVKSIIRWDSFGMNIVLPITTNFPKYDSVLYYPKVGCRFGVAFPAMLRLSITISLPTYVIAAIVQERATQKRLIRSNTIPLVSKDAVQRKNVATSMAARSGLKKKRPATDSVRRVGLQFTFTYDQVRGIRSMVGPTVSYLPGVKVLELLKPTMLFLPTVALFAFNMLTEGTCKLLIWCVYYIARHAQRFLTQQYHRRFHPERYSAPTNATEQLRMPTLSDMEFPNYRRTWSKLSSWVRTKTPLFACNLGYFTTSRDRSMGSNLVFELQPFFPLHKHLTRLKTTPLFHYVAEGSAKGTLTGAGVATAPVKSSGDNSNLVDLVKVCSNHIANSALVDAVEYVQDVRNESYAATNIHSKDALARPESTRVINSELDT